MVEDLVGSLGEHLDGLRGAFRDLLESGSAGTLLNEGVVDGLTGAFNAWTELGATIVAQASEQGPGCSFPNTMLDASGDCSWGTLPCCNRKPSGSSACWSSPRISLN